VTDTSGDDAPGPDDSTPESDLSTGEPPTTAAQPPADAPTPPGAPPPPGAAPPPGAPPAPGAPPPPGAPTAPGYTAPGYDTAPAAGLPAPPAGGYVDANGQPIDPSTLPPYDPQKKLVSGLLAILIGSLGIHKFYLGYTTEGILQIVLTIFTCGIGAILPLIEGIIYLTKSDEEFYWTYVANKKGWL